MQWKEESTGFATPCHVWTGTTDTDGRYGTVYHAGRYKKAHRMVWERNRGPIEVGLQLHHLCGVTLCVNLDHLVALSNRDHVRTDRAKLSPDIVRYIRRALKSQNTIARELGISESLVSAVRLRQVWADVE